MSDLIHVITLGYRKHQLLAGLAADPTQFIQRYLETFITDAEVSLPPPLLHPSPPSLPPPSPSRPHSVLQIAGMTGNGGQLDLQMLAQSTELFRTEPLIKEAIFQYFNSKMAAYATI